MKNQDINTVDIMRLRELESKATRGPWTHDQQTDYVWGPKGEMIACDHGGMTVRGHGENLPMDTNGQLMCEARNALPALFDELEWLRKNAKLNTEEEIRNVETMEILTAMIQAAEARVKELEGALKSSIASARRRAAQRDALQAKLDEV